MSRESLLTYLANEVIVPDIEKGTFAFETDQTMPDDVEHHYMNQFGKGLKMQEKDWEFILEVLERWSEHERERDPSHRAYLQRENLWEEMISRCDELPSYDQVEEKLGLDVAETYLMEIEEIENYPEGLEIGIESDFSRTKHRRNFSKPEVEDIIALVSILAIGDREASIDDYERRKQAKSQHKREKRGRIRAQNEPFIDRAQSLAIWFPYPDQVDLWRRDTRTAPYFPYFSEMLKQVKQKLRGEQGVLQYIPKRRLTNKTAVTLPRNLENMGHYLMMEH